MALGDRIRQRREEKRISPADLARLAGISKGYLSELESGRAPRPSAELLYKISTVLGTSIADLLEKEVRPPTPVISDSLRRFIEEQPDPIPDDDVQMLARVRFRGEQPTTPEDWRFLYESIKRSIRAKTS